jgi:photosystem II stability/assembly factor-like uncharacterized protein
VYRSVDGGTTWTLALTEADAFQPQMAAGGGMAVVSAVGFSRPAELLVSTDGGVTWVARPHPTSPQFGASPPLFADGAGRIYVEDGNRLLRSADLGVTWTALGAAGSPSNRVASLHHDAGALCLGTSEGVWCSANDGVTFAAANAGLPGGGTVRIVALARDTGRYVALTAADGVFVSDAATAEVPRPAGLAPSLIVTPNPAAGAAEVVVELPAATTATVEVFDAVGRRAARLHAGPLAAGTHHLPLETGVLPPGVYVVRLSAGRDVTTRRFVSMR